MPPPREKHIDARTQRQGLRLLADMTQRSIIEWRVREAAIALTDNCRPPRGKSPDAQTDLCEIQSIFSAVKDGDTRVRGLEKGVRYVSDPIIRDYFLAPHRLLEACENGACGEDCDSHAALVAAMLGAIGFEVGLRAWGKAGKPHYQHVYAVVVYPKRPDMGRQRVVSLDTTVPTATVGWEPPKGRVLTAWIHEPGTREG